MFLFLVGRGLWSARILNLYPVLTNALRICSIRGEREKDNLCKHIITLNLNIYTIQLLILLGNVRVITARKLPKWVLVRFPRCMFIHWLATRGLVLYVEKRYQPVN